MLRLLILRHAKASSPTGIMDIDRPLAPRGRAAAIRMGEYLRDESLVPDLAVISPSNRTRETWDLVRSALEAGQTLEDMKVSFEQAIYAAPAPQLLGLLHQIAIRAPSVLLVGHNPGCEELAQLLTEPGDTAASDAMQKFPTAALAVIDFDADT